MKRITDDETLGRLHARGNGFIYNDFAGRGTGGEQYNVLHAASCRWNGRSNTNVPKYFFEELDEAVHWLEENRGAEGQGWKRCGSCRPGATNASRKQREAHQPTAKAARPLAEQAPPARQKALRPPFVVRRSAKGAVSVVEAWSERRLPFEPRGWQLEFREALRRELGAMEASPEQVLHAVYQTAEKGSFDIENVLFYNVGPQFIEAGRYGLRFERNDATPPDGGELSAGMAHYHRYMLAPRNGQFAHWQSGALVARWEFELPRAGDLLGCARVWLALKRSGKVRIGAENLNGPLVLRVAVATPARSNIAAAVLVKPLVDGLISAFHCHDGGDEADLASRLEPRTGADPLLVAALLRDRKFAVLGPRKLLWKFRSGVQWNPADHRCVAVELQLREVPHLQRFAVRGELTAAMPLS